ncbi:MAG: SPASM domain-containing protein [Candidatus Falkowbacteria bacterium]|nr:SPASM domain-containing protein [Candidatus Falkowbacteria bacterium]
MVVTQANYQFIRTTAKEMAKLGVKRFAVTPAAPNVKHPDFDSLLSKPQIIDLFEDLKWCVDTLGLEVDSLVALPKCFFPGWYWDNAFMRSRSCQAGRMSVNVSNVGNVRPCPHNPIVYGNLFQESMETIWDKMSIYRDGSIIPSVCKCCPTVLSCKGACRINALAATGKLDGADRLIVGHLELPKNKQSEIEYKDDSIIHFKGKLHWRKETDGYYSISSKNNHGNIMIVNEEMFRFVYWLEKSLPLTVKELMTNSSSSSDRDSFLNILKSIIRKEFVFVA